MSSDLIGGLIFGPTCFIVSTTPIGLVGSSGFGKVASSCGLRCFGVTDTFDLLLPVPLVIVLLFSIFLYRSIRLVGLLVGATCIRLTIPGSCC